MPPVWHEATSGEMRELQGLLIALKVTELRFEIRFRHDREGSSTPCGTKSFRIMERGRAGARGDGDSMPTWQRGSVVRRTAGIGRRRDAGRVGPEAGLSSDLLCWF
jgi:hypothetical protein